VSRITEKFRELKQKGRAAFIPYITAGDPDLDATEKLLVGLAENGADIIELGIPFSDPMADGPTIQAASDRALKNYFTLDNLFEMLARVQRKISIPIILFSYYNPIFIYGEERFISLAQEAGADGVLVLDLPPEEGESLRGHARKAGMDAIYLVAPTSTDDRIKLAARASSGFIYYVSVTGVTGARETLSRTISRDVARIRKHTELPIAVGFGISSPEQAETVAQIADGVVVGSAIVKVIAEHGASGDLVKEVGKFVGTLSQAVHQVKKPGT
jgi:tryptophan synthase alpha chain